MSTLKRIGYPGDAPRAVAPIRTETKELETQALGFPFTFKCYDTDVMVPKDGSAVCPEEP